MNLNYLLIGIFALTASQSYAQATLQKTTSMKLNAGIVTPKLEATKDFYINTLGFGVTFENEFYLLLHTPGNTAEISFLLPNHPSQQPVFQQPFSGKGMYLTIEVENADAMYAALLEKKVRITVPIRDEPWGDRHFAVEDPNGIAIDIVQYAPPVNDNEKH